MSIQLPAQPWAEGDTFTNDATGVEYTFDGVKWLASGGDAALEQQPPVHVGDTPPDDPSEGDLWMLDSPDDEVITDRLFVYVDDTWEPTTSLQRERQHRIAEDLIVATQLNEADGQYMLRLDPFVLPEATMTNKGVVIHDGDLPEEVTDDKVHFKQGVNTGSYLGAPGELAYRGPNPGDDIKHLIIHHHKNADVSYREEWIVKDVRDVNGTIHVRADRTYGDTTISSERLTVDVWLMTAEQAQERALNLSQQGEQLLLDGSVVGDSEWESRITANESDIQQMALGLQSISTPRCNGLWKHKPEAPARADGEFSFFFPMTQENNYLNVITTDLNHESILIQDLVKVGDYVQIYNLDKPDSFTLHTVDSVAVDSTHPPMVGLEVTLVAHGDEIGDFEKCAIRFFAVTAITELNERMDALEEAMRPWMGVSLGVFSTKRSEFEPTGSSQAEGTAVTWWTDPFNNSNPNNHARIGMTDKNLLTQIVNMPAPFELDLLQDGLKQTWVVADAYERGVGVLHLLATAGYGDRLTHTPYTAVDTEFVVRKI